MIRFIISVRIMLILLLLCPMAKIAKAQQPNLDTLNNVGPGLFKFVEIALKKLNALLENSMELDLVLTTKF
jgi:hypothetical protein